MKVETSNLMNSIYSRRYKYFQYGHTCKYKNQKNIYYADFKDTLLCDCTVSFERKTRTWYLPIELITSLKRTVIPCLK